MLIRSHPDFLILPSAGHPVSRKRRDRSRRYRGFGAYCQRK